MEKNGQPSPCLTCTRVPNPADCENKMCRLWQKWYICRWEQLRRLPQLQAMARKESTQTHNPCSRCSLPRELCSSPCRERRLWDERKGAKKA